MTRALALCLSASLLAYMAPPGDPAGGPDAPSTEATDEKLAAPPESSEDPKAIANPDADPDADPDATEPAEPDGTESEDQSDDGGQEQEPPAADPDAQEVDAPKPEQAAAPKSEGPPVARASVDSSEGSETPPVGKGKLGCRGSKSCFNLTITGTVLGILGLGSIGTGAALLALPDEPIGDEPAYVRSTKPPGLVATTLGAGVVLTSILMIVAAQRGARAEAAERPREQARRLGRRILRGAL